VNVKNVSFGGERSYNPFQSQGGGLIPASVIGPTNTQPLGFDVQDS